MKTEQVKKKASRLLWSGGEEAIIFNLTLWNTYLSLKKKKILALYSEKDQNLNLDKNMNSRF